MMWLLVWYRLSATHDGMGTMVGHFKHNKFDIDIGARLHRPKFFSFEEEKSYEESEHVSKFFLL